MDNEIDYLKISENFEKEDNGGWNSLPFNESEDRKNIKKEKLKEQTSPEEKAKLILEWAKNTDDELTTSEFMDLIKEI